MTTVTPPGWIFLAITNIFLPILAIWSATRPRSTARSSTRAPYFISVIVTQGSTLFIALSAASYDELTLFPLPSFGAASLYAAFVFLPIALGTLPLRWSWKSVEEKHRVVEILPHKSRDIWWWVIVAVAAGIIEEIVYRGVMFGLWQRLIGSELAIAACVVVFVLVHYVQGWRAMIAIGMIALAFHVIVLTTGNLYTAMILHILYDLFAGMIMLRLARRDRVLPISQ